MPLPGDGVGNEKELPLESLCLLKLARLPAANFPNQDNQWSFGYTVLRFGSLYQKNEYEEHPALRSERVYWRSVYIFLCYKILRDE